jgi:ATP-dependent DNA helicase RecQ
LQEQAMRAVLDERDSLVVLPTGGGKSLCYQAPAVLRGGTTVVVSPLIALMKDQVDGLKACGVPAAQLDSSLHPGERDSIENDLWAGRIRLLFVSPERLAQTDFPNMLRQIGVHTFAIDEAHCISHWGHDFRPEYRQLQRLRQLFPQACFHGYTATATESVRQDIVNQLGLRNPAVLVGTFDRPNLTYRVLPRQDLLNQVLEVLKRHPKQAGIIYCFRRSDVDELAADLQLKKINALPYHAGMETQQRQATQNAFAEEQCDVVVATIAFGMGIDRSNVRFVLHTALPKSIEHYQQETGRAGRDGLEAECVLLYSGGDVVSMKKMLEKSAAEAGADPTFLESGLKHLNDMHRYARGAICRHKALSQYFGQPYYTPTCQACDVCLGDTEGVPDALVVAQKILSCVARVQENFGVGQVLAVLRGKNTEAIRKWGHDKLTTFGLLRAHSDADVRDWIYQLIGQEVLVQVGEYPVLKLNDASWEVMRGQRVVRLVQLARRQMDEAPVKSRAEQISWEGVDHGLFEELRVLRRELAVQRGVQPYLIFNDKTLRDLARVRPSTLERMRELYGVGEAKLRDFGPRFLALVADYSKNHGLKLDAGPAYVPSLTTTPPPKATARQQSMYDLFRQGLAVEDVAHQSGLRRATVMDYLAEFIRDEKPGSIEIWVPGAIYRRVAETARQVGTDRLKPIYLALGEKIGYDEIRLVVAHLRGQDSFRPAGKNET